MARLAAVVTLAASIMGWHGARSAEPEQPRNIVFILVDDLRFDALGFLDPRIRTPNLDRLAREGGLFRNAFVTTSLCSPSRATILTGQTMRNHGVIDNNKPLKEGTVTFPELLQRAGYTTAFIGKWHMGGDGDDPQPGFDHWVSFRGQGGYNPGKTPYSDGMLNINGKRLPQKGYITDELTDYALDWLEAGRDGSKPFLLYLSHKAVHAFFEPAKRHEGLYAGTEFPLPGSATDMPANMEGKPLWVRNQRNSWHGIEFPYLTTLDYGAFRRDSNETLAAVDDSLGRLLAWLEAERLMEDTVVIFTSDNGFLFGEHGLIDKRNAYEESIRVPMLVLAPGLIAPGIEVEAMVANLDIAPTILDIAGIGEMPAQFEGASFLGLAAGTPPETWRDELVYEYYWEYNYPQTPTTFALRTDRYKLIQYHGVWDIEELYDLEVDPNEMHNLIYEGGHEVLATELRVRLYEALAASEGAHVIPYNDRGAGFISNKRIRGGSVAAQFPERWLRDPTEKPSFD